MKFSTFLLAALLALTAVSPSAQAPDVPSILVSRQLAAREGLTVGDEMRLATDVRGERSRTFRIAGIYEPTPDPMRLGSVPLSVRMHLPDLLALTRDAAVPAGTEHVEAINVALADPADAETFSRDFNARAPGAFARPTSRATDSATTFVVLERFHAAIAAVTVLAATVFLLALTVMLVDERRETVGVLRLIGLPVRRILLQVLVEGVLVAGLGALFGLLLALGSEGLINRFFQWRYDTALVFVRITPRVALICLAIAVPLGAVATVVASWALLRRGGLRLARR
ncbi:MAG: FtsX-like permease family protein [Acidobacteria bacterium]|nr:FtsX-like permease family protein [Acidobacteriota bacterium]